MKKHLKRQGEGQAVGKEALNLSIMGLKVSNFEVWKQRRFSLQTFVENYTTINKNILLQMQLLWIG